MKSVVYHVVEVIMINMVAYHDTSSVIPSLVKMWWQKAKLLPNIELLPPSQEKYCHIVQLFIVSMSPMILCHLVQKILIKLDTMIDMVDTDRCGGYHSISIMIYHYGYDGVNTTLYHDFPLSLS